MNLPSKMIYGKYLKKLFKYCIQSWDVLSATQVKEMALMARPSLRSQDLHQVFSSFRVYTEPAQTSRFILTPTLPSRDYWPHLTK
jgi:hypothetical protein